MARHQHLLSISLDIYDDPEDLAEDDRSLLEAAQKAAATSHSPYSRFKVGAALRLASGTLVTASNQENIAYPAGLCAESICMFSAGSNFPDDAVTALAVTTLSGEDSIELLTPCGICRQVISEYRSRQQTPIRILMRGQGGQIYIAPDIQALLPLMFEHGTVRKQSER
ncbi:MAG: cytidine deaminase [Candidatus Melainabacteria bacterium HGW-Melainabacteria-1]|nr:MAG: cytidine deaminase [Candidatus Melainabacteria bacterium HGW-Melainabacteria-1]